MTAPYASSRARSLALPATVVLLLASRAASAQHLAHAPRACTNTAAASLVTTARTSQLSAIFTDGPPTLWVLFTDRDGTGHDTVSLLEVSGLTSNNLSITTHAVGDGTAFAGGLSAVGGNVVAVYARADHHVGVFVHPIASGHDSTTMLDAPHTPTGVSVSGVRGRGLVSWDEPGAGLHLAWIDGGGANAGPSATVTGSLETPWAVPSFGGAAVALDHTGAGAHLAVIGAARRRAASVRSAAGAGDAVSLGAVAIGPRVLATYARGNDVHLAQLAGATGAGGDAVLATVTASGAETAVSNAPWGAIAGWTDAGVFSVVPLSARGAAVTTPFPISHGETGERVHGPALASVGSTTVALWTASGLSGGGSAVRMVRLSCQ